MNVHVAFPFQQVESSACYGGTFWLEWWELEPGCWVFRGRLWSSQHIYIFLDIYIYIIYIYTPYVYRSTSLCFMVVSSWFHAPSRDVQRLSESQEPVLRNTALSSQGQKQGPQWWSKLFCWGILVTLTDRWKLFENIMCIYISCIKYNLPYIIYHISYIISTNQRIKNPLNMFA
jgi:hypothetical protein